MTVVPVDLVVADLVDVAAAELVVVAIAEVAAVGVGDFAAVGFVAVAAVLASSSELERDCQADWTRPEHLGPQR